jgi:1-deoxy-D-xylulose-5-phosphate reductoisomerase
MLALCMRFRPPLAAMLDAQAARALRHALAREGVATRVVGGAEGLVEAATLPAADTVVAGIVGAAGCIRRSPRRAPASAS